MPYTTAKRDGKWKVFKKGADGEPTGEALGTFESESEAEAQITAIEANENKDQTKEADKTKCGYYDEMYVPWGVTTFEDLEAAEAIQESAIEAKKTTSAFSQLASNILGADITDKAGALSRLASDYTTRLTRLFSVRRKELANLPLPSPSQDQPGGDAILPPAGEGLFIWKENGEYKWFAAYSNNYRDNDNPPEIISAESHRKFDKGLEAGKYPMPELWPWHVPYRGGVATMHAYDEATGFTIAAGTFDKDKEWMAEGMMKAGWGGVSHGMPSDQIEKDTESHIITDHVTREISPLPPWAAANKLSFNIISKENIMGIPAHKRDEFVKAFGEEKVMEIEKALEGKAKEAQEAGLEQKEATEAPATPAGTATPGTQAPAQTETMTPAQVADAIIMVVTPLAEAIKAVTNEIKELKRTDAEKVAEKAAGTPVASLESLLSQRLPGLFSEATEIDGRTSLAKSKPKQKENQESGLFFQGWTQ